jgi:hypothetical protein
MKIKLEIKETRIKHCVVNSSDYPDGFTLEQIKAHEKEAFYELPDLMDDSDTLELELNVEAYQI